MITVSKVSLLANAFDAISLQVPGIMIVFSPSKLAKAPFPILVTLPGMVMVPVSSNNNRFP